MTLRTLPNGDSETRTRDLYVANVSLSQLSYIPISLFIIARLTKNARKIQIRKRKKKSKNQRSRQCLRFDWTAQGHSW